MDKVCLNITEHFASGGKSGLRENIQRAMDEYIRLSVESEDWTEAGPAPAKGQS